MGKGDGDPIKFIGRFSSNLSLFFVVVKLMNQFLKQVGYFLKIISNCSGLLLSVNCENIFLNMKDLNSTFLSFLEMYFTVISFSLLCNHR